VTQNSAGNLAPGNFYMMKFDLTTAVPRIIEVEWDSSISFQGFYVEPTASLSKGPATRFVCASIGDSIVGGAGTATRSDNWSKRAGHIIGCEDSINLGIGGSGYAVGVGVNDFITRIPDVVAVNPDVVFVQGGQNDFGGQIAPASFTTAVANFNAALKTALPNALVFIMGIWNVGDADATYGPNTRVGMNNILKAQASASGFFFIDQIDPSGVGINAPAWAASTAYTPGDIVTYSNAPFVCVTGHTSTSTFSRTNFIGTSWIQGTGKVGSPTGLGNADLMIQADGVHQTPFANDMMERRIGTAALAILRAYALS
jgi:lysophospholipase L1-like esterase